METITISYDKSNRAARKLMEGIVESGLVTVEKRKRKTGMELAMEDINRGRVYKLTNLVNPVAEILR